MINANHLYLLFCHPQADINLGTQHHEFKRFSSDDDNSNNYNIIVKFQRIKLLYI